MLLLDSAECTGMSPHLHHTSGAMYSYLLVFSANTTNAVGQEEKTIRRTQVVRKPVVCPICVTAGRVATQRLQDSGRALVWHWHRDKHPAQSCCLLHLGFSWRTSTHIRGSCQSSAHPEGGRTKGIRLQTSNLYREGDDVVKLG